MIKQRMIKIMPLYRLVLILLVSLIGVTISLPVISANVRPINPGDQAENYRRQEKLQERIERETESSRQKALEQPTPNNQTTPVDSTGAAYLIKSIGIESGSDMPDVYVDDILSRYENRRLNASDLYALVQDVTNRYVDKGFVTTVISLQPTNLNDGAIRLIVHWGRVEGWLINGQPMETWQSKWLEIFSLPNVIERPLNIRDIDRAIEVLNNGTKSAKVEVAPGTKTGYSRINIIQTSGRPLFTAGLSNQYAESTADGRYQGTLGMVLGDALLPNDRISTSVSSRYYNEPYGNDEYVGSFGYSLPVGYSDVSFRYSRSTYHREIIGAVSTYGSNGKSETYGARYAYNLWRDRAKKFSLYSDIEAKNTKNYIEDFLIGVSSKPYRLLSIGGVYVGDLGGGTLYSDLSLSKSLSAFGGEGAALDKHGQPKNFSRVKVDASWSYPFAIHNLPLEYVARTSAQYSGDSLVSSYKMGIGDEYTVRGYKGTPSWGDRGVFFAQTLSHTLSLDSPFGPASIKFSGGLDWGRVEDVDYAGGFAQSLVGVSAGVRASLRYFSVGLGYGLPLKKLDRMSTPSEALYLSLDANY